MKNKLFYFTMLFVCSFLYVLACDALAANSGKFISSQFAVNTFTNLNISDLRGKSNSIKRNVYSVELCAKVIYPLKYIIPEFDIRLISGYSTKHAQGFSDVIESPNQELKERALSSLSATLSLRFQQRITSNLNLYYLPGVGYLYFYTLLKVYDRTLSKDLLIFDESQSFFGPTMSLEPILSKSIFNDGYSAKQLYFSPKYTVMFSEKVFHEMDFMVGMESNLISRDSNEGGKYYRVFIFLTRDINDIFKAYAVGLGYGRSF